MDDRLVGDIIILLDGFIESFGLYCAEWEDMSEQSKRQWTIEFCREHASPIDIKELEDD